MKSLIAFIVIFIIAVISGMWILSEEKRELPIINPVDVNPDLVDPSLQNKGNYHTISDFYLQNQDGIWVDKSILNDKIAVVNYFFATCPGICPLMNGKLAKVYGQFKNSGDVLFLSHTVMPETDTAEALKEYAESYGADSKSWMFLTGDKSHLYELARKSYLVAPDKDDPNYSHGSENDFIHTENVVLIDTKGQIRGMYDGTSDKDMKQLAEDINLLLDQ
ncbi:SCO family protein [Parvicella tangerina]|uniref:Thioredoxin domain-containing protein n=1 Tax=Parvicella tangerina TaxID=2829795 RepID=A0A916JKC3_9FLAO|nr:SCO family protein [Parvicella tangerina]CAG5078685.1 hypothetical protein CRYO30217_00740 [Parvicella tangerina]